MNTLARLICLGMYFGALLTAADPVEGTWKLNLSKSKYVVSPAPKSFTIVIRAMGTQGFEHKVDGVTADGQKVSVVYTAQRNGAEAAITGDARYDTIRVRSIDDRTEEAIFYKGGKEVRIDRYTLSSDGRERTLFARYPGATTGNTAVYDKQP
jgi:hypothetical protein